MQAPYNPLHKPEKHVSDERMKAILAKHTNSRKAPPPKSPAEHSSSASASAGAPSPLVWQKVNDWLMRTSCGTFRCRKFIPGDANDPGAPRYQLELLMEGRWHYKFGRPLESFKAAREAAEHHREAR